MGSDKANGAATHGLDVAPSNGNITIDLEGRHDMDPRAVADAIIALESLVRSFDSDAGAPELRLAALSTGSAHVSLVAPSAEANLLRAGLAELSDHPVMPQGWTRDSLRAVVELGRVSRRRGVDEVMLQTDRLLSRIDATIQSNAERLLAPAATALGSVRGVLYRYTNDEARSRRSAGLRDYRTNDVVEVTFPADLATDVRACLETEAEVWGVVERDIDGRLVKVRAEGIEKLNFQSPSPDTGSVRGLFGPEWTGGMDSVSWVRAQRDQ